MIPPTKNRRVVLVEQPAQEPSMQLYREHADLFRNLDQDQFGVVVLGEDTGARECRQLSAKS
jgi:hypothetical protein